jgi:deferrochelatase/peroxidase EfeB
VFPTSVDPKDVQGLVRFGYGKLTEARYLLLRIRDAAAARAWCAAAEVSTAEYRDPPPPVALHVAFTAQGLRRMGVAPGVVNGFSPEFRSGMAGEPSRSRRLGDVGANAPASWQWGGAEREPDLLVMLFAASGRLPVARAAVESDLFRSGFDVLFELGTSDLRGYEPFGFRDGISQPEIDWERKRDASGDQLSYSNVAALGEFLLGYPNEYGKFTQRPLIDGAAEGADVLLPAEDRPEMRDLGRNGTYLVIRQLEQNVRGFWTWTDRASQSSGVGRMALAEAMVGRTIEGNPLVGLNTDPIPGISDSDKQSPNRFTYEGDAGGTRCPFGAHIRRANPRNADIPGHPRSLLSRLLRMLSLTKPVFREDVVASTRFHRLLRRGREYGPPLSIQEALEPAPSGDPARGIHFVCLNANIGRQFEFVQNAWIMSTKFDGLSEESDPILGNRVAVGDCPYTGNFSMPREGAPPLAFAKLPQFVTVRGGAYFFLPGLRALRYISGDNNLSR